MATNPFLKLRMAMFTSSAKRMSYELREHRSLWETEWQTDTLRAKRQHRRRFRRTATYCMHVCYNDLMVELEELLLNA